MLQDENIWTYEIDVSHFEPYDWSNGSDNEPVLTLKAWLL